MMLLPKTVVGTGCNLILSPCVEKIQLGKKEKKGILSSVRSMFDVPCDRAPPQPRVELTQATTLDLPHAGMD